MRGSKDALDPANILGLAAYGGKIWRLLQTFLQGIPWGDPG